MLSIVFDVIWYKFPCYISLYEFVLTTFVLCTEFKPFKPKTWKEIPRLVREWRQPTEIGDQSSSSDAFTSDVSDPSMNTEIGDYSLERELFGAYSAG